MPGRKFDAGSGYRYGFNRKEKDNSTGEGNLDFGARIYDGRIGRWLSIDPLQHKYPSLSPYIFAGNKPVKFLDVDGKDFGVIIDKEHKTIIIVMNQYTNSDASTKQAKAAAMELNNTAGIVEIDGVNYSYSFKVDVIQSSDLKSATNLAAADPIGNLFLGTTTTNLVGPDGNVTGGRTTNGRSTEMYNIQDPEGAITNMGDKFQLVGHEFLHHMGQEDEKIRGNIYFDPSGRMKYVATVDNNYKMNDISKGDIKNILMYAGDHGYEKHKDRKSVAGALPVLLGDASSVLRRDLSNNMFAQHRIPIIQGLR